MSEVTVAPDRLNLEKDGDDDGLIHLCKLFTEPDSDGRVLTLCGKRVPHLYEVVFMGDETWITPEDCVVCLEIARKQHADNQDHTS